MNNENNSKGILRELTAIRVRLDTISEDVKYLKDKVENLDRKTVTLETYRDKIDNLDSELKTLKSKVTHHEIRLDTMSNTLQQIVKEKSFKSKVKWNFATLFFASLLASLIVLFVGKIAWH